MIDFAMTLEKIRKRDGRVSLAHRIAKECNQWLQGQWEVIVSHSNNQWDIATTNTVHLYITTDDYKIYLFHVLLDENTSTEPEDIGNTSTEQSSKSTKVCTIL